MPSSKRNRRTSDQLIADLQAQIARIKSRAEQAKVKKDPSLRHIAGAVRSIDKAMRATRDSAARSALAEARATLSACLALQGAAPAGGKAVAARRSRLPAPEPDDVLEHLRRHPGSRSEEIAAELGTDALSLRAILHELRDAGRIKVEGKARATRYTAVGGS
jgi:hypothetical protein